MAKDMTVGSPGKGLIAFALPMVAGNVFQQLYNIIDSIIVGNYVGADALAAVGTSSAIVFLFVAIAAGLSVGASVVISQYFGAKKYEDMRTAIYTILCFVLVVSLVLSVVGYFIAAPILRFMNTPDVIFQDAKTYLQIYFYGLVFLFLYNMLTAAFNAIGDSRTPLVFLLFSSVLNIVLDLYFVIELDAGVAGVAYATLIAQAAAAVVSFFWIQYKLRKMNLGESFRYFDMSILKTICRVAIPSMVQQSIVSIGSFLVQRLVNGYGPVIMAGYAAATKIDTIAIVPMINVGNAVSTFTAQNIGAGKPERVKKGLRAGVLLAVGIAVFVTIILLLAGEALVGAFVDSESNRDVIATGVEYLRVVGISYFLLGIFSCFIGVLRGAGDVYVFMFSTLSNLTCRVVFAYALSALFLGASGIWFAIPIGWSVGLLIGGFRYRSGKWKNKAVI